MSIISKVKQKINTRNNRVETNKTIKSMTIEIDNLKNNLLKRQDDTIELQNVIISLQRDLIDSKAQMVASGKDYTQVKKTTTRKKVSKKKC